jgi:hypothetical protein
VIDLATLTIDPKRIRVLLATMYHYEEDRDAELRNTTLHLFVDNRRYDADKIIAEVKGYVEKYAPALQVEYWTDLHKKIFEKVDLKSEKAKRYVMRQTHHIKMSIPLILHDANVDRFFFFDDDVLLLRSPKAYFGEEFKDVDYVLTKDAFSRFNPDGDKEFDALASITGVTYDVKEQNRRGIMSVGQWLFRWYDDYLDFCTSFYNNEWFLEKFFTKVWDFDNDYAKTDKRGNASFIDEQRCLTFYFQQRTIGKFLRGDVVIHYERPEKYRNKGYTEKRYEKNMLVHYGSVEKKWYMDHFMSVFKGEEPIFKIPTQVSLF